MMTEFTVWRYRKYQLRRFVRRLLIALLTHGMTYLCSMKLENICSVWCQTCKCAICQRGDCIYNGVLRQDRNFWMHWEMKNSLLQK